MQKLKPNREQLEVNVFFFFCYFVCAVKEMCETIVCIWLSLSTRAFEFSVVVFFFYIICSFGQRWNRFEHLSNNFCMAWCFVCFFFGIRLFVWFSIPAWPSITQNLNCIFNQKRLSLLLFGFKWNRRDRERRSRKNQNWPYCRSHEFTYTILSRSHQSPG